MMKAGDLLGLVGSALLAAAGQLLFRHGAKGITQPVDFFNAGVLSGAACYGLSTILWIWVLSRLPLVLVYPFTMLTFVLVYAGSAILLGERPSAQASVGLALILAGLATLAWEPNASS